MTEPGEPKGLTKAEGEALLEAGDLADRLYAHEREARQRLVRAAVATVGGPSALGLLVIVKRDAASLSAVAFLAALMIVFLAAMWGNWWFFAASDLTEVRKATALDRILGKGGARSHGEGPLPGAPESGNGEGMPG
jgi:hypothetical protein